MTPLTQDPALVVLVNPDTAAPVKFATNVAPDLAIRVTEDPKEFAELAKGSPFVQNILSDPPGGDIKFRI